MLLKVKNKTFKKIKFTLGTLPSFSQLNLPYTSHPSHSASPPFNYYTVCRILTSSLSYSFHATFPAMHRSTLLIMTVVFHSIYISLPKLQVSYTNCFSNPALLRSTQHVTAQSNPDYLVLHRSLHLTLLPSDISFSYSSQLALPPHNCLFRSILHSGCTQEEASNFQFNDELGI